MHFFMLFFQRWFLVEKLHSGRAKDGFPVNFEPIFNVKLRKTLFIRKFLFIHTRGYQKCTILNQSASKGNLSMNTLFVDWLRKKLNFENCFSLLEHGFHKQGQIRGIYHNFKSP